VSWRTIALRIVSGFRMQALSATIPETARVDPDGTFVADAARACQELLYADVDPQTITSSRFQLDAAGHYGRPDIFQLTVDRSKRARTVVR
jgi:hypothetical protein